MTQIDELRQIIVGDNAEQLNKLKERIENVESRAQDVSEVLATAIDVGIKKDDQLLNSLKAPVSESIKKAIRAEPVEYAEILYPVMGPSIRRAISQAISSLLITINHSIESATSVQGIALKIKSMRTGVPYEQLVLRQSISYQIEHIYLIDRDSGLKITEIASDDSQTLDSDAVTAMFSAIQSFVQDSFSHNEEDRLTDLKVGEHNVWIVHGPKAMLACVIYGSAPQSLRLHLYDVLDSISINYGPQLASFDGDSSGFININEELESVFEVQSANGSVGKGQKVKALLLKVFVSTMLLLALGYGFYTWIDGARKLNTVEHYLDQTPGLFVTSLARENGKILIRGLKDPLAELPYNQLTLNGIDVEDIELEVSPFRSLDPEIESIRRHAESALLLDDASLEKEK